MKSLSVLTAASILIAATLTAEPVKVIFDTDMLSDYDDVGALAILHTLADAGEAEILAVGVCTWGDGNRAAGAVEAINNYYGRGGIPVGGTSRGGLCQPGAKGFGLVEKYPQWVRYPFTKDAPSAVEIYRKALAAQPDGSVTMVSVGFMNNMADLVRADRELVAKKVKLWVCMACSWPNGKECNSQHDPESSDYAFRNWPTPIIWTDFQYGRTCYSGRAVSELPDNGNPVRDVFKKKLMPREKVVEGKTWDQLAGHPSWDETAVLIAVRGWEKYFNLERGHFEMVGDKGDDKWVADEKSASGRVTEKLPKAEVGKVIDELMCRPPAREFFDRQVYGVLRVGKPDDLKFETVSEKECLGGTVIHRTVKISCNGPRAPFSFNAHAYFKKGAKNLRTFVHAFLEITWKKNNYNPDAEDPSFVSFPVKHIIDRGFAAVAFNVGEVAPDNPKTCFDNGVFKAFGPSEQERRPDDGGAIAAWAWGASRVMDWVETQPEFDAKHVAVIGHSRGGKTALVAGARDHRFALTCVNDSGCSGAKLNKMDLPKSEHIERINTSFPHWFCLNYRKQNGHDMEVLFDQDRMAALIAPPPRKVAIASGSKDDWAGPPAEKACAENAAKLGADARYHVREGGHGLLEFDWDKYMDYLGE